MLTPRSTTSYENTKHIDFSYNGNKCNRLNSLVDFANFNYESAEYYVSVGDSDKSREFIVLKTSDKFLDNHYKNLLNKLPKHDGKPLTNEQIGNYLKTVNEYIYKNLITKVKIEDLKGLEGTYQPLNKFIESGNGVCRHRALLAAYFLGRLVKDSRLPPGEVYQCRDNIVNEQNVNTGGHVWAVYKQSNQNFVHIIDPMWGFEAELTYNAAHQNLPSSKLRGYGSMALNRMHMRYLSPHKDLMTDDWKKAVRILSDKNIALGPIHYGRLFSSHLLNEMFFSAVQKKSNIKARIIEYSKQDPDAAIIILSSIYQLPENKRKQLMSDDDLFDIIETNKKDSDLKHALTQISHPAFENILLTLLENRKKEYVTQYLKNVDEDNIKRTLLSKIIEHAKKEPSYAAILLRKHKFLLKINSRNYIDLFMSAFSEQSGVKDKLIKHKDTVCASLVIKCIGNAQVAFEFLSVLFSKPEFTSFLSEEEILAILYKHIAPGSEINNPLLIELFKNAKFISLVLRTPLAAYLPNSPKKSQAIQSLLINPTIETLNRLLQHTPHLFTPEHSIDLIMQHTAENVVNHLSLYASIRRMVLNNMILYPDIAVKMLNHQLSTAPDGQITGNPYVHRDDIIKVIKKHKDHPGFIDAIATSPTCKNRLLSLVHDPIIATISQGIDQKPTPTHKKESLPSLQLVEGGLQYITIAGREALGHGYPEANIIKEEVQHNPYEILSNFSDCQPIIISYRDKDGSITKISYPTPEHYYQAQKIQAGTPDAIKRCEAISKQKRFWTRAATNIKDVNGNIIYEMPQEQDKVWQSGISREEKQSSYAMFRAVLLKMKFNQKAAELLYSTGSTYIVEDNWKPIHQNPNSNATIINKPSRFWGAGKKGQGANIMGLTLMRVRKYLHDNYGTPEGKLDIKKLFNKQLDLEDKTLRAYINDEEILAMRDQAQAEREAFDAVVRKSNTPISMKKLAEAGRLSEEAFQQYWASKEAAPKNTSPTRKSSTAECFNHMRPKGILNGPPNLKLHDKIMDINTALSSKNMEIKNNNIAALPGTLTYKDVIEKGSNEIQFKLYDDKITTERMDQNVFEAMLIAYKVGADDALPEFDVIPPDISTIRKCIAACQLVYKDQAQHIIVNEHTIGDWINHLKQNLIAPRTENQNANAPSATTGQAPLQPEQETKERESESFQAKPFN